MYAEKCVFLKANPAWQGGRGSRHHLKERFQMAKTIITLKHRNSNFQSWRKAMGA